MTSSYDKIWQALKKEGKIVLKLNPQFLENEDKVLKRIKKAITKRKYMDDKFKSLNPNTRIFYEFVYKDGDTFLQASLSNYVGNLRS